MATSGSSDFTVSRDEVINGALRIVRAYTIGEAGVDSELQSNAAEALNLLLKNLSVEGLLMWTQTSATLSLVTGQSSYTIGPTVSSDLVIPRPTKITEARRVTGTSEIPVSILSRRDYMELNDKTSQGTVVQIYYDRQVTDGVMYVWSTPDNSTDTIKFTYERVVEDFDASGDNPDLPPEWFRALKFMLASDMGPELGIKLDRQQYIDMKADFLKQQLLDSEVEPYFQFAPDPDLRLLR